MTSRLPLTHDAVPRYIEMMQELDLDVAASSS